MLAALKTEVIDRLFLHEYFHINVSEAVKKLEIFMKDQQNLDPSTGFNRAIRSMIRDNLGFKVSEIDLLLRNMNGHGEGKFAVSVDIDFAANLIIDEGLKKPKRQILQEFENMLSTINNAWTIKVNDYMVEAMKNIEADVRY